jgi:linoleate 8R-lipoxygenase / 9,12-octadecadienoate 8-hydroperoxide 8R-isomerase
MSLTTSYLDLSPLYGSNQNEQNKVRTFQDGQLKPDCFSEDRLGAFPPGVGALLLCFNRFHNYVVGQLATINENGKFTAPDKAKIEKKTKAAAPTLTNDELNSAVDAAYTKAIAKRDNDLFQTGRLFPPQTFSKANIQGHLRLVHQHYLE